MKRLIFTSIILIACLHAYSQELVFTIKETGTNYSTEQLSNAMNTADWCGFYYDNSKRVLYFDDGAVVELRSAQELLGIYTDYNLSCTSVGKSVDNNIYSVHASGRILIRAETSNIGKQKPTGR